MKMRYGPNCSSCGSNENSFGMTALCGACYSKEAKIALKNAIFSPPLVVTRHKGLLDYLLEEGIVETGAEFLTHVTEDDVRNRTVFGVLPLHLAALCESVTEIPLDLPLEMRGKELTCEQVRSFAGTPQRYVVRKDNY